MPRRHQQADSGSRLNNQSRRRDESPYQYTHSNGNSALPPNTDSAIAKASAGAGAGAGNATTARRSKSSMRSSENYHSAPESRSSSRSRPTRQQQQYQLPRRQPQQRDHGGTPRTRGYSPGPRQGGASPHSIDYSNVEPTAKSLSTTYDRPLNLDADDKQGYLNGSGARQNSRPNSRSHSTNKRIPRRNSHSNLLQGNSQRSISTPRNLKSPTLTATTASRFNDDQYNTQVMKEREAEILKINQQMNTVNEIYKDLAGIVQGQQELIDQIDEQIELSNGYAKSGNENYLEARLWAENPIMEDPFGDKLQSRTTAAQRQGEGDLHSHGNDGRGRMRKAKYYDKRKRRSKSRHGKPRNQAAVAHKNNNNNSNSDCANGAIDCSAPIDAMPEEVQGALKTGLQDMKELGNKIITACTAPQFDEVNEYAYRSSSSTQNPSPYDQYGRNGQGPFTSARYSN